MQALDPNTNVTVAASAGSGKTYLLVSRLIRLLLEAAAPNSIVAITFTRKAASEMLERLNERLYELASVDDQQLALMLRDLGLNPSYSARARGLYEALLLHPQSVKITTFHAFCHDLLQRFPLEAGINPGFELLESSTLLKFQAWQRLLEDVTKNSNDNINNGISLALDRLFKECSNPLSIEELLLNDFLEHRSDWWAFVENETDPVASATAKTRALLKLEKYAADAPQLPTATRDQLKQFSQRLSQHATKKNLEFCQLIETVLEHKLIDLEGLTTLHSVFFTKTGALRKREPSKAQAKSMGAAGEQQFIELHHSLANTIEDLLDKQCREHTAAISHAWYTVGNRLLEIFQDIKRQQNCLDFADLEWQVYKLLSDNEQSHWVQYKLDQRIDHILIDEFQDTNPTQWRMLHPLLEEITGHTTDRQRSVFIVGDGKQSIYRFRRAAPGLFSASQAWLQARPAPHHSLRLDQSRRSSPAIINLVNQVFSKTGMGEKLIDFQRHDTVHKQLWGHTELLPLIENEDEEGGDHTVAAHIDTLRNPLLSPLETVIDKRYQQEGQLIATKIEALIAGHTAINEGGTTRPVHYGDIMILVKKRHHVGDYENALLAAGIPFIGTQRKSLLSTLEIQDMLNLCNTLLTPHSNLALAIVLRSPIFSCSDEDLMSLATASDDASLSWYSRLDLLVQNQQLKPALTRAHKLLGQWHALAGTLPVHDLLDHIYHQGNVIARYEAAFPAHYGARAKANLTRFIELALEIDSGRYPSLPKFIYRLELLAKRNESPDESLLSANSRAVRLMTIHSAKGLEAPVVFIADASNQEGRNRRHHPLIDWPADKARPDVFFLSSMHRDRISKQLIETEKHKESIEDANLLYVAITRARQLLFVSGVKPRRGDWTRSWYGQIAQQIDAEFDPLSGWTAETGNHSRSKENIKPAAPERAYQAYDATPIVPSQEYAPTRNETIIDADADAIAYGNTIHHLLDLLSSGRLQTTDTSDDIIQRLRTPAKNIDIAACWQDALAVYTEPALQICFNATHYQQAFNETSVNAIDDQGRHWFGIVDRIIISTNEVLIIDYKSQRDLSDNVAQQAEQYRGQLARYRQAAKQLWPNKIVRAAILFTTQRRLHELSFDPV